MIRDRVYGIEEIGEVPSPAFVMNAIPKLRINTPGIKIKYLINNSFPLINS